MDQTESDLVAQRRRLIDALMHTHGAADVVLRGGNVVSVTSGEIIGADVAILGRHVLKVGDCDELIGPDTEVVELDGAHVLPGLIDAHMHFESALLSATEFVRVSIPTGTTTIVSDPHEIGNVLGPAGVREMALECAALPVKIHTRVPCSVPDVAPVETNGVPITSVDVPEMLQMPTVDGIGEIQSVGAPDFVARHTPDVFDDVLRSTVYAREHGAVVDGNAAAIFGDDLAAHIIAAGTDISCHETTTKQECVEKLRNGVWVLMREGSTQRNMQECIRAYVEDGLDPGRLCLCTDDMLPDDLRARGHMNDVVRRTIAAGIDPVLAIQMATVHPANWMRLNDVGALTPGKVADICVVAGPLAEMNVTRVYIDGRSVAQDGELLIDLPTYRYPDWVRHSVKRAPVGAAELAVEAAGTEARIRAVGLVPDQNLSEAVECTVPVFDGIAQADPEADVMHAAVVERYGHHGGVGRGFIAGFGMQRGAIAETVSHNSHNIIAMGATLPDMVTAINAVIDMQGGIVLVDDGEVIDSLPLPVAGLINDQLGADELIATVERLTTTAQQRLGITVHGPFMHLAFLSLTTSPVWKLTDRGLLDVDSLTILPTVMDHAEVAL